MDMFNWENHAAKPAPLVAFGRRRLYLTRCRYFHFYESLDGIRDRWAIDQMRDDQSDGMEVGSINLTPRVVTTTHIGFQYRSFSRKVSEVCNFVRGNAYNLVMIVGGRQPLHESAVFQGSLKFEAEFL